VLIVVEAIVRVVSEVDLSPVLDGLAALDAEKGPFNMNARKIRRKKREDLEALEIGLLDAEYPPQFQRSTKLGLRVIPTIHTHLTSTMAWMSSCANNLHARLVDKQSANRRLKVF
jgi:hypothetical protein